jgi:hypothetical protein
MRLLINVATAARAFLKAHGTVEEWENAYDETEALETELAAWEEHIYAADPTSYGAPSRIEDVQIVLDALIGREPTENEWENVPWLAALRRIEQTLEGEGYV